jgi:VIT1/CCC1 family predicted Fe2+/Mn2+ transporter
MNDAIWDYSIGVAQGLAWLVIPAALLHAPLLIMLAMVAVMFTAMVVAASAMICGEPAKPKGGENNDQR